MTATSYCSVSKNAPPTTDERGVLGLDSGLEALQDSPEFRGPVESLDGHHCNDHFAQIYETSEEKFAASVPFVRQGLERGERCMYVVDESSEEEVVEAMHEANVDVDAALDSGALTFHTIQDTYLRNDSFDPDEMIDFYAAALEEVTSEYEGLCVAAETTWLQEETTTIADFMEYESKINDLFENEDCLALCQYDRNGFPPEVVRDIIKTHPHLIYDGTVCHNFYYTPPEEFFGSDEPAREVDRMMGTLLDRTRAKTTLQARQEYQRELYEITASADGSFEEKTERLLELGCERFDLDIGFISQVDGDAFEIVHAVGSHEHIQPGATDRLSETYCRQVLDSAGPLGVQDALTEGWEGDPAYGTYGLDSFVGTTLSVGGEPFGTLCFASQSAREEPFTDAEYTFLELMGQWMSYELDRVQRERFLREQNDITASPDRTFEEKLQAVFDLGCERFGLELGAMACVDTDDDWFEVEYVSDDHEHFEPGVSLPLSETYCTAATEIRAAGSVSDPDEEGYDDITVYREFGIEAYLGTYIAVDGGSDRTFFFVSSERRTEAFSEEERTFVELMGQWLKYEIERRQRERHQRTLYEIAADTDRTFEEKLQAVFDLGCERFGLELGGLARVDPATDFFEVEAISGDHEHLVPGAQAALSETYCRVITDDAETAGITDPVDSGFDGATCYDEFGVNAYLGTHIEVDGGSDRTFFFVSSEPRTEEFSETEHTFHRLMGQWVSYELERKQREDNLAALNALTRDLMHDESVIDVSESVVETAEETLDLPVTAIALYDDQQGVLRPTAETAPAATILRATNLLDAGNGIAWDAFVEDTPRQEIDPLAGFDATLHPSVTEVAVYPLGKYGVFITGSTATDGFSPADFDFVGTVVANVQSAFDRADREQQVHEREEILETQNETLERLNRVNDIIRSIDQALVNASNRAEIETVVCEQLADVGPYEFAWIGNHDTVTDEVVPRKWAGNEKGYLDEISVTADESPEGQGPAGRAVRTREPQVLNNILDDPPYEPWRQAALNRGYHASIALPLVYEGSLYGVLNVYAGQPDVFDDLERSVLAELSDTVAYAINAVESKKALVGDTITELKFDIRDTDTELVELSSEFGCTITFESVIPQTDGQFRIFFSTRGVPPETFVESGSRLPATNLSLVSEHEEDGEPVGVYDALLTDESFYASTLEHGGVPREITVGDGDAYILVELAGDAATREFVEMFRTNYPGAKLVAQRTRERSHQSPTENYARLTNSLTDRQFEVLQTAFFSGYFEKPRTRTGSEIATTLDITQPTFNHHVRAAQRKLLRSLFEDESSLDVASLSSD